MLTETMTEREMIEEGLKLIEAGLNTYRADAKRWASLAIRDMHSFQLDLLAKIVLREVARRGIDDRNISARVFVAAELLLKEE